MNRHTTSGRWGFGLTLALLTTLIWGILPIVLKILIINLDVYTLTWYRFVLAAGILAVFIIKPAKLKSDRAF